MSKKKKKINTFIYSPLGEKRMCFIASIYFHKVNKQWIEWVISKLTDSVICFFYALNNEWFFYSVLFQVQNWFLYFIFITFGAIFRDSSWIKSFKIYKWRWRSNLGFVVVSIIVLVLFTKGLTTMEFNGHEVRLINIQVDGLKVYRDNLREGHCLWSYTTKYVIIIRQYKIFTYIKSRY